MSILRYTTKYLLYSGISVVVILCIVGMIYSQLNKKSPVVEVSPSVESVERRASHPLSGGHFHSDGTWHSDARPIALDDNKTKGVVSGPGVSQRPAVRLRGQKVKTPNKSGLGWITWKFGRASGISVSPYYPDWTPLPEEITDKVGLLTREQEGRKWVLDEVSESERVSENKVAFYDYVDFVGESLNLPNPQELLLDKKGNPLPLLTDEEYKEEELRRLVGDRDLEAATKFLEQHGHYNELLLSRLNDERAFDYLYAISSPNGSGVPDGVVGQYAERVVGSDPSHLKARLYLADTAPRSSSADYASALDQYEAILVDHPDSPHALIEAAGVLTFLDNPLKAIAYFEKGHGLGARQGYWEAATAYQKLGDYKTAWVYLNKAVHLRYGHGKYTPRSDMRAIEEGRPRIAPLPVEKLDFPDKASLDSPFGSESDFAFDVPGSESEDPFQWDPDLSAEESAYQRAKVEADAMRRQEIERMRQMSEQEIDAFIEWAEQLMRDEASQVETTNFLAQEMAAHLSGQRAQFSPRRIVRANELIKRYGYEAGLSRIIKDDPEIAIQIQLLRNQESNPDIKNMKKE